jgi:hypothetical protein
VTAVSGAPGQDTGEALWEVDRHEGLAEEQMSGYLRHRAELG